VSVGMFVVSVAHDERVAFADSVSVTTTIDSAVLRPSPAHLSD